MNRKLAQSVRPLDPRSTRLNGRSGRSLHRRAGVTILEVLFATGIAITGLVGISALLLMAGNQASQANRALETQALADSWYNEFLARGMHDTKRWVWFQDYRINASNDVGLRRFAALGSRLSHSAGSVGNEFMRPFGKHSVCIDPVMLNERTLKGTLGGFNEDASSWFRPAVFPYYQDGYNPEDSPLASGSPWMDQPRMMRVSLDMRPDLIPGNQLGYFKRGLLTEAQMQSMFVSENEIVTLRPGLDSADQFAGLVNANLITEDEAEDKSVPAIRGFDSTGKPKHNALYSWFATISPLENTSRAPERYHTLSLAVTHKRDRLFYESGSADVVPQGEQVFRVEPLSGNFVGGNGGRVRLWTSDTTEDNIEVGNWIMLSKYVRGERASGSDPIVGFSVFRWFRIVGTDSGPLVAADDDWSREVVLDGPDWQFVPMVVTNLADSTTASVSAPTTGTIVSGVVAVHERVIEIPDAADF